jgi:hypothetical protein
MRRLFLAGMISAFLTIPADAQQPPLDQMLARAAEYSARYMGVMSTLIAEERYVQNLSGARPMVANQLRTLGTAAVVGAAVEQVSRADVLLMRVGPPVEWRVFRDVFEVNEKPVRDRDQRLARLFLEPADTVRAQAQRIADESARFNISRMGRWLNEPGLPLVFLQAHLQARFQFTLDKRDGSAWIVKYEERARPTLFKHNTALDNPSTGRFWIEPETGEVTRAEQAVKPGDMEASFTTTFKHDDRFGIAVPVDMRETLSEGLAAGNRRLTGSAKYSNYREAKVITEQKIKTPAPLQ